jgi:hypothetical protein
MTAGPATPAPRSGSRGRRAARSAALWFGLFGASVAWAVQEIVGYGLTSDPCAQPSQVTPAVGTSVIVSAALTLAGAAALVVATGAWRRSAADRSRFMALGGILVSALFLMALAANLAVLFLVPPCGRGGTW